MSLDHVTVWRDWILLILCREDIKRNLSTNAVQRVHRLSFWMKTDGEMSDKDFQTGQKSWQLIFVPFGGGLLRQLTVISYRRRFGRAFGWTLTSFCRSERDCDCLASTS